MKQLQSEELMVGNYVYNEKKELCMVISLSLQLVKSKPARISLWNFSNNNMELDTECFAIPVEDSIKFFAVETQLIIPLSEEMWEESDEDGDEDYRKEEAKYMDDHFNWCLENGYEIDSFYLGDCLFDSDWNIISPDNEEDFKYIHQCQMYSQARYQHGVCPYNNFELLKTHTL